MSYFRVRCVVDLRARRELGARPPRIETYFPALMSHARDARWGKEPSPRWAVGRQPLKCVA